MSSAPGAAAIPPTSPHDGKDAAVVAELAAQGRSWPGPLVLPGDVEQELAYQVGGRGEPFDRQQWYRSLTATGTASGAEPVGNGVTNDRS